MTCDLSAQLKSYQLWADGRTAISNSVWIQNNVLSVDRENILPENRTFKGLENFSRLHLLKCMRKNNLLKKWINQERESIKSLFENDILSEEEKNIIIKVDSSLEPKNKEFFDYYGYSSFIGQSYDKISNSDFDFFTRDVYVVFEKPSGSSRALLIINNNKCYILYKNLHIEIKDIVDSGTNDTIIDGYYKLSNKTFYPIDAIKINSQGLEDNNYHNRLGNLRILIDSLNKTNFPIKLSNPTDNRDIINKSQEIIKRGNSVIFIPLGSKYEIGNKNINIFSCCDSEYNNTIILKVLSEQGKYLYNIGTEGTVFEDYSPIKLPASFAKDKVIVGTNILFKFVYDKHVVQNKLQPLKITQDEPKNMIEVTEIKNLAENIISPYIFEEPVTMQNINGWRIYSNGRMIFYYQENINEPLKKIIN